MSLVGNLAQFSLADLLQILSSSGHSGKISLTRIDKQGVIVLRQGRMIYAASTSVRDTLGSILVSRGQIDEEQLTLALERKHQDDRERRLGNVLVEMDALTEEELRDAVRWQMTKVLAEFVAWKDAYFRFEPLEISDHGEVEVDLEDLVASHGFDADRLMFGILGDDRADSTERLAADMDEAISRNRKKLTSLEAIMTGLQVPALTGELVARILGLGSRIVPRGALFTSRNRVFGSRASFGLDDPSALEELLIPMYEPSVVGLVSQRMEAYRGPLFFSPLNERLIEAMGGEVPEEVLAIPIGVGRHVEAVFYGHAIEGETIGASDGLELLLLRAGVEIEEAMLEKRKAYLERVAPASEVPAV